MPSLEGEFDCKIGSRLRARREAIGISADELADACGLTVAQVLKFEAGSTGLSAAQLCQLADLLEVPMTYFHGPRFTAAALADSSTNGQLLEVFSHLSAEGRQEVLSLAVALARRAG